MNRECFCEFWLDYPGGVLHMHTVRFEDPDELLSYVASLLSDVLLRGQCEHYTLPDGSLSLIPSQLRKGCTPPLAQMVVLRR